MDAYIIDELRRRQDEAQQQERPMLELPLPEYIPDPDDDQADKDRPPDRGVTIVDYTICQL